MARRHYRLGVVGLALGLLVGTIPARGESPFLKKTISGTPQLKSIEKIRFGPQGLLLIGDGRGSQVLVVETGDTAAKPTLKANIEEFDEKVAGRLGTMAKNIKIVDLAVNPASGVAYLAVLKDNKQNAILTVDGAGTIGEFVLDNVKYARATLPAGEKSPVTRITDLAWAGDRILVAGVANEEFASKISSIPLPLEHDAAGTIYSTETYHVSHGKWETRAPISTLMPFEEDGKKYLIGSFACTPLVKYPLDDLKPGAHVKGISVVELGSGNLPLHMFSYEKDGKHYVLINTNRFHHKQRPFGPSPHWTVRVDRDLFLEKDKVNEKAIRRLDNKSQPATEQMKMIEAFHGVVHMDKLDKERVLVLKEDGNNGFSLGALPLP